MSDADVPATVRSYLLSEHENLLATAVDCADAVAAGWDGESTTDRDAVAGPLTATLRRAGVLERLPAVLAGAVDAAGYRLRAEPVAAPPYVVVTSTGPVLRATLADGRLVVSLRLFAVEREGERRYVRGPRDPGKVVDVAFR
ncbi:hypothetical protein SAMN04487948_104455 [Halogranum amylolyticum]|uniref:DUF7988 domain-containing protein n=1 Tax=Halogranum amylolyticum TaxID=660520 RepID=A0A1H8S4P0_9EURY|nr:hypothetical protein [Halogranum amylolyticum]SEO73620.1 hypothetical protein SAMN04487948_104455 [Halogranum amylolyticum]